MEAEASVLILERGLRNVRVEFEAIAECTAEERCEVCQDIARQAMKSVDAYLGDNGP